VVGVGTKGGILAAPASVVVPEALDSGVRTVFTYPTGTAVKVDQAEDRPRDSLASCGASVDRIEQVVE